MHLGGNRRWVPLSLGQNHKTLNVFGMQPEYQQDVTKTRNGERGAGSGERGTEVWERVVSGNLQKNPKWRSKKRDWQLNTGIAPTCDWKIKIVFQ